MNPVHFRKALTKQAFILYRSPKQVIQNLASVKSTPTQFAPQFLHQHATFLPALLLTLLAGLQKLIFY